MEGKDNSSTVRMLNLEVASLAMDFLKAESLQRRQHLAARQQRQLQTVNSTTSRSLVEVNSDGGRLQIQINGFPDILQCLFASLALGPTALQRRAMRDKIAILARFNDDFQVHGVNLIQRLLLFKERLEKCVC
jgi:hypothetical protein